MWPGYSKLPLTKTINAIGPPYVAHIPLNEPADVTPAILDIRVYGKSSPT